VYNILYKKYRKGQELNMNKYDLSYKLKYILNELGMNRTELLEACKKFNPSISKPTIINAINGKNKTFPRLETLDAIIKVCKTYGNEKIKYISYDFLLNDNINQVEAKNATLYQSIGLSDDVINRLKQYNHPLYFDYGNIINYYLYHIPAKHWRFLKILKTCDDIYIVINKEIKKHNEENIKEMLKLFNDDELLAYIKQNFKNIYELYINIKNNKEKIKSDQLKQLKEALEILIEYLEYKIIQLNKKFLDNIKE
jgi:hypothetical protein